MVLLWMAHRINFFRIKHDQLWYGQLRYWFFIVPMGEELGISRTQFSTIPLFKLATIPVRPLPELLVDRKHGARIILILGSLVGGGALIPNFTG